MIRTGNSPEDKKKKEQYENNQQDQVWYNLWLHVLLIIWCVIPGFKLDFSSRGQSGVKAASLQACSTYSKVVLLVQQPVSISVPRQAEGLPKLTLQAATSHTSLLTVTFTPSTSVVVVASTDAADEVSKQESKAANESSRRTPLHCAMVT